MTDLVQRHIATVEPDIAVFGVRSLLNQRADPNSSDSSMSALMRACAERHPEIASQLLFAGASVDATVAGAKGGSSAGRPHQRGLRALHHAARDSPVMTKRSCWPRPATGAARARNTTAERWLGSQR